MAAFSEKKSEFDNGLGMNLSLHTSLVPVDGRYVSDVRIKNNNGDRLEEYYKWQFIYSIINSSMYNKDYIGTEVRFPKGNKSSAPLKIDCVIFDSVDWIEKYNDYWRNKNIDNIDWLNEHIIAVVEFKKGDKEIEKVYNGQIKSAMKQKEPSMDYVLGIYYDTERMYLFHRRNGLFLRYDENKNIKGDRSKTGDLSLQLFDPYIYLPDFKELISNRNKKVDIDRSDRTIDDLDTITSRLTISLQDALSDVLRSLDKVGLVSQRGYEILIQTFALKIYDEKHNKKHPTDKLKFYITDEESSFESLRDEGIQNFICRLKNIWENAEGEYSQILGEQLIDWREIGQIRVIVAICRAFQDFSFVRSSKSDIYQMIFYNFANAFKRDESAQFLTPLPIIDFLVKIVNPRKDDTVLDPCCGIGDFLSLSYVNALDKPDEWKLSDANVYGVDIDPNMIKLATLNMLLNGDGEAKLFYKPDMGSISWKIAMGNPPELVELEAAKQKNGEWNNWSDKTKLMQFDVVLTNPPFGEDRAFRPSNDYEKKVIEAYELWNVLGADSIDKGIIFLENAYRMLKVGGRMGIVLSNSISSIKKYQKVREWLMKKMRIVAVFDLPPNVFAETGVNTSIIVAYKPDEDRLRKIIESNYSIFAKDIKSVGYEKRTSKRNVVFNPTYKIDYTSFEIEKDADGNLVLDEEFSDIIKEFRDWCVGQEKEINYLFLKED
jgi:type I restriction enzyme M protein